MPTAPADIHEMRRALPALLADANKTLQEEHVMLISRGRGPETAANDSASDGTEASALLDDSEAYPSPDPANPHSPAAPRQEEQSNVAAGFVAKRESPPREGTEGASWGGEATEPVDPVGLSGSESDKVPTPAVMRPSASTASLASLAESASLVESSSAAKGQEAGASGAAAPAAAAGKTKPNLNQLHACMHCRAAKTACTDCRPCKRCVRLGLECMPYRDEPRKRACQGCHTAKVACSVSAGDTCARCRRLGVPCVPRDAASARNSVRKRKRPAQAGALPLELLGAAQAAALELSPAGPRPVVENAAAGGLLGLLHLAQAAATEERYPEDRGAAPAVGAGVGVDVGGSRLAGVEGAAGAAPPQKVLEFSHSLPSAASTTVEL